MEIGIIGAGFTGLTAGYKLSKLGHKVTIFENSDITGGLAGGFKINEHSLEKAYHHFFSSDIYLIELIKELGLEDKILWLDSSTAIWDGRKYYPFTSALDLLKFKKLSLINRIRSGLVFLLLKFTKNWEKFDSITAKDWLIKWNGEQAYKVLWKPILTGKFHDYADQISMAWMWGRINSRGSSKNTQGEKLGYINGGFQVIIDKLEEEIKKNNGEIILKTGIRKILNKENKVEIKISQNGKKIFDKLIVTIPSYKFADLVEGDSKVSDKNLKKLRTVNYIGAITMIIESKIDLNNYYWTNITDPKAPFLAFINHTKLTGTDMYYGKDKNYIYYLAGYYPHDEEIFKLTEKEIEKKWLDYLVKMTKISDIKKAVINTFVFKFANAQHITTVGYKQKTDDTPRSFGNIFLTNFSLIYPWDRGVNWAVESGMTISNKILQ